MSLKDVLSGFDISGSGMSSERARMDVIAGNIANASVTRMSGSQQPYQRRRVLFRTILSERGGARKGDVAGVKVGGIVPDRDTPFVTVKDPGHPDSDANGYVRYPNVNVALEMADMITALRAYEANALASRTLREMADHALRQ